MKILKEILIYILIILSIILIRTYLITPVRVNGSSMNPTLVDKELLILSKINKNIKRFDIVVLNYDNDRLVKRVIGLPGDHVKYVSNLLYVNEELVLEPFLDTTTDDYDITALGHDIIPDDYYFVLGDNRNASHDSRIMGLVKKEDIIGKTLFRFYPFNKIGKIK